jgi:hypothetical protein
MLPIIGVGAVAVTNYLGNPSRVAYALNISSLPRSLRVIECGSDSWADVVITCAVEVDPTDFPLLLKGYAFSKVTSEESSYSLGISKVGPEFTVATEYRVEPASFKYGGAVRVFADAGSRHAVVDLYIE